MLVGYLGPKGSFSHQVAQKAFPEAHLEPYPNITEVIKAYERGQVDLSIVPVENSIEGSVHDFGLSFSSGADSSCSRVDSTN